MGIYQNWLNVTFQDSCANILRSVFIS